MKAKELIEILSKYPEFDVKFSILEPDGSSYGIGFRCFDITIDDIGHCTKVIYLGSEEKLL